MPRHSSLAALTLLVTVAATAQQSQELRGRVVDSAGAAISGAHVSVATQTATTSAHGEFALSGLHRPATVTATSAGFAESTVQWNGEAELTIMLRPMPVHREIVVSATRTAAELADVPSSITLLNSAQLASSPALMLDDVLRQAPGFSLFRRSDSRTANPTSQGVSLRGAGASGASRALVLYQGVPLNDPFGGWVYWDRVPAPDIEAIEILRGGGAGLYGSGASAGVVSIQPRPLAGPRVALDSSLGTDGTDSATTSLATKVGKFEIGSSLQGFQSDGYIPIPAGSRGAVDRAANLRYGSGRLTIERDWSRITAFASGDLFDEGRQNGTALQTNSTRLAEGIAGVAAIVAGGTLDVRVYGSGQHFNQTFTSISADRNRETLVRIQAVPAQQNGLVAQWNRTLWKVQHIVIGADVRRVEGRSDEQLPSASGPTPRTSAGGRQLLAGVFLGDTVAIGARIHLAASFRVDHWRNYGARTLAFASPAITIPQQQLLLARSADSFSPSLGANIKIARGVSLKGSGYGSFRAPTLNELYRAFRLGNVQTLANDALRSERLWGGEGGVLIGTDRLYGSASVFYDEIHDAIGNRTLSTTATLITRQRQNIGTIRTRGFDFETHFALTPHFSANGSYEYVDAIVLRSLDPALVGLAVPQVPRHAGSAGFSYTARRWSSTIAGRYVSRQFDDDLNQFPLAGYFSADGRLEFRVAERVSAFVAVENGLDRDFAVARTPALMVGAPRLVRAGVTLHWAGVSSK